MRCEIHGITKQPLIIAILKKPIALILTNSFQTLTHVRG
jgi:hypothetical protein